jgi:hypothetical protein
LAVGLLLALPQITTLWMNPAVAGKSSIWLGGLTAFIAVFNFAAGIAAALNFRRPV